MAGAKERYEVFARNEAEQPLRHIGLVEAATLDDAEVFAKTLYEEWSWIEMVIAPRRAVVEVIRPA
jgi:hypothetical protein